MAEDQTPCRDQFAPIKRPRDTAYAFSPYNSSQAPWTATRCLRLLRPISSKINTLERLRKSGEHRHDDDLFYDLDNDRQIVHQTLQEHREFLDESWDFDPRPRKKVKRTYSSRTKQAAERGSGKTNQAKRDTASFNNASDDVQGNSGARNSDSTIRADSTAVNEDQGPFAPIFKDTLKEKYQRLYQCAIAKHVAERSGISQPRKSTSSGSNERLKLCRGITAGLSALLKATAVKRDIPGNGAPSLYSMCLKKIPQFIAEEEHAVRVEEPDSDQDVISDVYAHLESQAITESWKPLRTVVRAHGVQYICAAIDQNILSFGMSLEMVKTCLQEGARNEAVELVRQILITFLQKLEATSEPATSKDQSQVLAAFLQISSFELDDMLRSPKDHSVRLLSEALSSPSSLVFCAPLLISATTLAMNAAHNRVWDDEATVAANYLRVINRASIYGGLDDISHQITARRRLSHLRSRRSSRRQLALDDACKPNYCEHDGDRSLPLRHTAIKMVGTPISVPNMMIHILGVISFSREQLQHMGMSTRQDLTCLLQAMAQDARQVLEISDLTEINSRQRENIAVILWSSVLSELSRAQGPEYNISCGMEEVSALVDMELSTTEISLLGLFVHRTGDFCEHLNQLIAFDLTRRLVEAIMKVGASSIEPRSKSLLQKLAVSSAFAFCEASKKPSHLEWAVEIEGKIFGRDCLSPERSSLRTPARMVGKSRIGYRWEEGICEWITRTPASALDRAKTVLTEAEDTIDELDDTTLVEEWPMRLPAEGTPKKSTSSAKTAQSEEVKTSSKSQGTDVSESESIPVIDIDCETPCKGFDDSEVDELSENWCSQPSAQSSFQSSRSRTQPVRHSSSRVGVGTKSTGTRLLPEAPGRSLVALFDGGDQSSDMEDELAM